MPFILGWPAHLVSGNPATELAAAVVGPRHVNLSLGPEGRIAMYLDRAATFQRHLGDHLGFLVHGEPLNLLPGEVRDAARVLVSHSIQAELPVYLEDAHKLRLATGVPGSAVSSQQTVCPPHDPSYSVSKEESSGNIRSKSEVKAVVTKSSGNSPECP